MVDEQMSVNSFFSGQMKFLPALGIVVGIVLPGKPVKKSSSTEEE